MPYIIYDIFTLTSALDKRNNC